MPDRSAKNITIVESDIDTCVRLSQLIPEFVGPPAAGEYHRRMDGVPHLLLVAFDDTRPVGFKAGYQRDGYFYSWMGGIIPEYRQLGLAAALAKRQEEWARAAGYDSITFKTRNQHKAMLIFALKNGFDIIGFREKETIATNRILLRKAL
ncbi:GNAT family N-acetyltransferase [Flavilitoribacter nigricans DSM 23189 = NBRC 102662]|uniref:GNAT family N-acetyltransferase n=2 Tax=Flavilitoribacter TaxID=2762562 RepID=A0A2D0NCW4_FLAN2|nr:GNAT family N-acetyltransferase [Flavilitoribacter nigricans DSM 23189 = NBRC 102662]